MQATLIEINIKVAHQIFEYGEYLKNDSVHTLN